MVSFATCILIATVAFLVALGLGFVMALRAVYALNKQHQACCKNCEKRVAEFASKQ